MNKFMNILGGCFLTSILMVIATGHALAGGLEDTSEQAFIDADFETEPSANITNPWWTLPGGSEFLYYAETEDECLWNLIEVLGTTNEFFGSYAGTDARIVLDREWADEDCIYEDFDDVYENIEPAETTYDWYAQDLARNIWYMGEDTRDEEGSSEGSFVAGCNGAEAGIVILGDPSKGAFYQQEFLEEEAEDWGKVLNFKIYDEVECMKTKEWTPLEPGEVEHKFYCDGELVLIEELKGKTVIVELIENTWGTPDWPDVGEDTPNPIPQCEDD
jgi:hypothetical protein